MVSLIGPPCPRCGARTTEVRITTIDAGNLKGETGTGYFCPCSGERYPAWFVRNPGVRKVLYR